MSVPFHLIVTDTSPLITLALADALDVLLRPSPFDQQRSRTAADMIGMCVQKTHFFAEARQEGHDTAVVLGDNHLAIPEDDIRDEAMVLHHLWSTGRKLCVRNDAENTAAIAPQSEIVARWIVKGAGSGSPSGAIECRRCMK